MPRKPTAALLCLLLAGVIASSVEAGRGRIPRPNVVIDIAEVVYDNGVPSVLILRGDLFRETQGKVLLDGASLPILLWSNKTIEAELPPWVVPATYKVTVSKGAASIDNFSMDVAIGATGPEGPPGPTGPAGTPSFYSRMTLASPAAAQESLSAQASCDAGDVAVGGGISWLTPGGVQGLLSGFESEPSPALDAWVGVITASPSALFPSGTALEVSVVCADVTP